MAKELGPKSLVWGIRSDFSSKSYQVTHYKKVALFKIKNLVSSHTWGKQGKAWELIVCSLTALKHIPFTLSSEGKSHTFRISNLYSPYVAGRQVL